jgi:GNAT superfamily N-acetyltransferase
MKILTYDEVDPYDVYRLCMTSFGQAMTEKEVRMVLRKDPRYLDFYAVYAVEKGRPLAQVVPMKMPVHLTTGVTEVGGLQAVCSHPSVWGKGYARRLMQHTHDVFRSLDLDISTLTTSRNIRGYHIYQSLGYRDLGPFLRGLRRVPKDRARPSGVRLRKAKRSDLPDIQGLFEEYTKDDYGWTRRLPEVLPTAVALTPKLPGYYRILVRDRETVGYFRTRPHWNINLEELIAPDFQDFRDAVALMEHSMRGKIASVHWITSGKDKRRFLKLGYDLDGPIGDTTMAVPLGRNVRARDIPSMFGVKKDRFAHYPTDDF